MATVFEQSIHVTFKNNDSDYNKLYYNTQFRIKAGPWGYTSQGAHFVVNL